jgi:hypothetical protein
VSVLARLWALRRERPLLVVLSLLALAVLLVYPFVDWYLRLAGVVEDVQYYDFGAYMTAVDNWYAGEPIYTRNEDGGFFGSYLYPPVALLLFAPFAELPFYTGGLVFESLSLGALWVALQILVGRVYGLDFHCFERGLLLWALFGFHPILFNFKHGQVATLLAAILTAALIALELGEPRVGNGDGTAADGERADDSTARWSSRLASGALMSVAAAVKLTYATAGAHLLGSRDRLLGALAAGVGLAGLSLAVFGVDTHLLYLDVLRYGIEGGTSSRGPMLASIAYYRPLFTARAFSDLLRAVGVLAVVGLALAAARDGADRATFVLGVAAVPLLAPRSYTYTFVSLLPAVVALLAVELDRGDRPWVPVLALLLLDGHAWGLKVLTEGVPTWGAFGATIRPALPLLQLGLWGNLLLVGLAAVRVAEAASLPARSTRRSP